MSPLLRLADAPTARDVLTFVGRAARISDEGVRMQASGGTLALTAGVLAPQGLFDQTPTILGMRIVHADPELTCDIVVDSVEESSDETALQLPATGLSPAWAGVSPPQGEWEQVGLLEAAVVAQRAQWGISAVAHGTPDVAGEEAVRSLRARIWGEPDDDLLQLPRGVAFAADSLGFIGGEEEVRVLQSGRWTRLAFRRGHVLSRGPAVSGLTPVRHTGATE
ncbi:hypothetical protein [Microbacterium sp. YY-01]|uniref:hypothetical protein n=1 Tax=Microbacterium sp. YY-01 TaxID=3421634 RepID=UPI003D172A05